MKDEKMKAQFQCREIWGGNGEVEQDIRIGSLKGYLLSIPYEAAAGGDIHFLSFCEETNISKIVLADVAGHGDIVSLAALELRALLREHLDEVDNSKLLQSINHSLRNKLPNGRFVTMVAATFQADERRLVYAYAGHPVPLWYNMKERKWQPLQSDADAGVPLGIIGDTEYFQMEKMLDHGDLLLFYTDGLLNVRKEKDSQAQISTEEMLSLCQSVSESQVGPRAVVSSLISLIKENFKAAFTDDVTLLVVEIN
jgi:sigma-B regulation protein RsbU (phosphoserine phosphatase)